MKALLGWAAGFALALAPVTVAAQDGEALAEADLFAGLMGAFAAEPLTPEQEARLPVAQALIDQIMPPGSLQDVMGPMFGSFIGPIAEAVDPQASTFVASQLGLSGWELDMTEAQAEAAAALFDPAWREREQRKAAAMPAMMASMAGAMEEPIRRVMAELYAIYFTSEELADIGTFFATPSGATYARQSFSMGSDPRLAGAMMQEMPAMMTAMVAMEAQLEASTSDLPAPRTLAELTPTERKGLARLVRMTVEELELQIGWTNEYGEASIDAASVAAEAADAAAEGWEHTRS
jgi:hypothetical protein